MLDFTSPKNNRSESRPRFKAISRRISEAGWPDAEAWALEAPDVVWGCEINKLDRMVEHWLDWLDASFK